MFRAGTRVTALLIALIVCPLALAGAKIFYMTSDRENAVHDLDKKLPPDALAFKGYDDTPYSESIFYQFTSENGVDFFTHVIYADIGFTIKRHGLDFKVRYPDGNIHYFGRQIDHDQCEMAGGRFSWKLGRNSISGDLNNHLLHIEEDGVVVDVVFKAVAPIYRVGRDGMIYLDAERKKWGQMTFLTCFEVEGTLRDGATVIPIKGWGYGDHTRGNFIVTEFTRYCHGTHFYKDGLGYDFIEWTATEKYGSEFLSVLLVHQDGKLIHVSQNSKKTVLEHFIEPRSKKKIPASYTVESEGQGVAVKVEFTDVKLTDYNDPLIILSPVERALIELVSDAPLDLRFDGNVKLIVKTPEGTDVREGRTYGLTILSD
jgi:hypothetical protein